MGMLLGKVGYYIVYMVYLTIWMGGDIEYE